MIVSRVQRLPPLAWLFHAPPGSGRPTVFVGDHVDEFEDGVFEGCWAGDFRSGEFDACATVAGSGVRRHGEGYLFVTPSHPLEALYFADLPSGAYVSNSLAFLLVRSNAACRFEFDTGRKIASVVAGVDDYEPDILQTVQGPIKQVIYRNLIWARATGFGITDKPELPAVETYDQYRRLLVRETGAVFVNGASEGRRAALRPISTCSSGYDSAAASVIAAEAGCAEALTLRRSRGGADDSGAHIARQLGMEVHECERVVPSDVGDGSEAEFMATGMGGEDFAYRSFEGWLANRVLVTGFPGGSWERVPDYLTGLRRRNVSGSSLTEFRLRLGFAHLPMASIGAPQTERLFRIANSAEMRPFSVGGKYDKPIPRRILEESGIARGSFGVEKKAASVLFHYRPNLMSASMWERVRILERDHPSSPPASTYRLRKWVYWTEYLIARVLLKAGKLVPRLRSPTQRVAHALIGDFRTYEHNNPRSFFDLMAAIEFVRDRYLFEPSPGDRGPTA